MLRYFICAFLVLAAGCTRIGPQPVGVAPGREPATQRLQASFHGSEAGGRADEALLQFPPNVAARREGPYVWYPVDVTEAHALQGISKGAISLPTPGGRSMRLRYRDHIEHPNGTWTWIGETPEGAEAILTFGDDAVFGTVPAGDGGELRLTMRNGQSWLVEVRRGDAENPEGDKVDYLVPPQLVSELSQTKATASAEQAENAGAQTASTQPTIDLALGYTNGLATYLGGHSQAVTRLQNLVDVTNRALANSQINVAIRLVKTVAVNYPDATNNGSALEALTGYKSGVGQVSPDPAFASLRAARDQYGADLVSLVRRFRAPDNDGCGIAWLIGGGQSGVELSDAPFGYSVVSDGSDYDESNGKTYFCRDETLAHEIGHNLGQAHNSEDSSSTGAHVYSYGYRETNSSGFYTIMAYRLASQYAIRYFANPNVMDAASGRPTGSAAANNAQSMSQTLPVIARFRSEVMSFIDVPPEHWAFGYIEKLLKAGVSTGCSINPRSYCPGTIVRRDEMAVFLLRAKYGGGYVPPAARGVFGDLPQSHWAASWVERIYGDGITLGCQSSPLMYCPDAPVTREQMAVLLLRTKYGAGYQPPAATGRFADVPVTYWAAPWIERLASEGVTSGCSASPSLYCPSASVTRDQMAVFLARAFNL